MTPAIDLAETLAAVARAMAPARDAWWVIGSAAVALHGVVPLHVGDVDVLLSEDDARYIFPQLGMTVRPGQEDGRFRSRIFGSWEEPPLAVEFMAGLQIRDGQGWRDLTLATRDTIEIGEDTVFVPSRAELRGILARFGRPKDFERLHLLGP